MKKEEIEKEYRITKDASQALIGERICSGCGGTLEPIETEDNSGNPTYWVGCLKCSCFDSGVSRHVFETAKDLVLNQHYIEYNHLGVGYGKTGYELEYWQQAQIRGTCSTVLRVMTTYNRLADSLTPIMK